MIRTDSKTSRGQTRVQIAASENVAKQQRALWERLNIATAVAPTIQVDTIVSGFAIPAGPIRTVTARFVRYPGRTDVGRIDDSIGQEHSMTGVYR